VVYSDYVNILGVIIHVHTIEENEETLVVASMKIRLEVNADISKYMVMYQDQNAGQNHNMETDNRSFGRVE